MLRSGPFSYLTITLVGYPRGAQTGKKLLATIMVMVITALYAALLGLLFMVTSVRVSQARSTTHVSLGDGGNEFLLRRIRVHGNFAEYIPLALVVLLLAELAGLPSLFVHLTGATLLLGRTVMIYGIEKDSLVGRVMGMVCTYVPYIGLAFFLLYTYLTAGM